LDYIQPDYVHVLSQGRIVKSGDLVGSRRGPTSTKPQSSAARSSSAKTR
ncbi:hypothetical protein ACQKG5_24975, partial [Serratia bockelmannii]